MERYTIGLDVGGTKIQSGLVSQKFKVLSSTQTVIPHRTKKTVLAAIIESVDRLFSPNVRAIGIGITGLVDPRTGVVATSPNLPSDWHNVPLKNIIEKKFKVSTCIDNDAHGIALAEAVIGRGRSSRTVLSLTLGTGIGAGLVIDKQLYHGSQNVVELGHTFIAQNSPRCSCGRRGHFEALVSGPAMSHLYRQITHQSKTPHQIEAEAKAGKRPARRVLALMVDALAAGLANAIHSFSPDIIILGGGLSRARILVQPAITKAKQQLLYPSLRKTPIVISRLGYEAGVIGAALLTTTK